MPTTTRDTAELLASDWREWTLPEVVALLAELRDDPRLGAPGSYVVNRAYVEARDHWQDGVQWAGPIGSTPEQKAAILQAVKRQFTSDGALNEALERRRKAALKVAPQIQLVRPGEAIDDEEDPRPQQVRDAEQALRQWADRVGLVRQAGKAMDRTAWAGRGSLRVMALPSALQAVAAAQDGQDTEGGSTLRRDLRELPQALLHVGLDCPLPEWAAVVEMDDHTRVGVVLTETTVDGKPQRTADLWSVDLLDEGLTELVRLEGRPGEDEDATVTVFPSLELGGRIPLAEMQASPLVTESVRSMQRRLNYAQTLLVRCMESAGFVERYTINAADEGDWLTYPPTLTSTPRTQTLPDGKLLYFHPRPRTFGAGNTTELRGFPVGVDESGKQQFTTPGVVFREPTDPEYVLKAIAESRASLLQALKQGHLASSARVELSGNAYEQARADYVDEVTEAAGHLADVLEETLSVVLAYGSAMTGRALPEGYGVQVILTVRPGPVSPDAKRANSEMVEKGLLSRRTAIQLNGSDDPSAELAAIQAEEDESLDRLGKRVELVDQLTQAGAGIREAATLAGFSEDDAALLDSVPQAVTQ